MGAVLDLLSLALTLLGPAAVVGGITAAFMRASARSRGVPDPEAGAQARRGFWIAFAITFGVAILLYGLALAVLLQLDRASGLMKPATAPPAI